MCVSEKLREKKLPRFKMHIENLAYTFFLFFKHVF